MKKSFLVAIAAATLGLASCVTPKDVNYLQDMTHNTQIDLSTAFEARISPNDELNIIVSGSDETLSRVFNIRKNIDSYQNNSNQNGDYLVDVNGNIQFPILGEIHVAGMTRVQLQDTITLCLQSQGLLSDPFVLVRFANFKIYFLGAEGGKVIRVTNERCTFLEALAMSGDLSVYSNRAKVGVVREVNGKMVMRYLDPRSSAVFNDPFFMLQQNDIIITQCYNIDTPRQEASRLINWISVVTTSLTLITTLILLFKKN